MKRIFACLVLAGLMLVTFAPSFAGFYNRTAIKEWCVEVLPNGTVVWEMKTTSCLSGLKGCTPELCIAP